MSLAHYEKNKTKYIERAKLKREELRDFVESLKTGKPCKDCGQVFNPWQMEFDHLDGKTKIAAVSTLTVFGSKDRIIKEIQKCELVCSNCHADRTYWRRKMRV